MCPLSVVAVIFFIHFKQIVNLVVFFLHCWLHTSPFAFSHSCLSVYCNESPPHPSLSMNPLPTPSAFYIRSIASAKSLLNASYLQVSAPFAFPLSIAHYLVSDLSLVSPQVGGKTVAWWNSRKLLPIWVNICNPDSLIQTKITSYVFMLTSVFCPEQRKLLMIKC